MYWMGCFSKSTSRGTSLRMASSICATPQPLAWMLTALGDVYKRQVYTHFEPMAIYSGTKTSLDDIADGDAIAVPNDPVNENLSLIHI